MQNVIVSSESSVSVAEILKLVRHKGLELRDSPC